MLQELEQFELSSLNVQQLTRKLQFSITDWV